MKLWSDERLDQMLSEYCSASPEQSFVYDPDRKQAAVIPFWNSRKILATAASLVFVSLLSVLLYFSFGNKIDAPLAVAPNSQRADTPSAQQDESGGETADRREGASSSDITPNPQGGSGGAASDATESSGITPPEPSSGHASSSPRSPKETTRSSVTPQATEAGDSGSKTVVRPTDPQNKPSDDPTPDSPDLTQAPAPTQAPSPKPTIPRDPPWNPEPVEPTEGREQPGEPAVYPTQPEPKNYCYGYFKYNGGALYCWIADENGSVMGDPDLLSSQHRAEIVYTYSNGYVLARWSPNEHGIRPSGGYHKYTFLNANGEKVFEDYVYAQGVY